MPSMIKPAAAIIHPQKKYFLALKLAFWLILTKNWTYKSFRRPSYLQNWASVVLLRTMEEAQGGLLGALKIPAADASEDLPPESEPILCCIWPAANQSGSRKSHRETNQRASCNPSSDPLPPIVYHCPLLATHITENSEKDGKAISCTLVLSRPPQPSMVPRRPLWSFLIEFLFCKFKFFLQMPGWDER